MHGQYGNDSAIDICTQKELFFCITTLLKKQIYDVFNVLECCYKNILYGIYCNKMPWLYGTPLDLLRLHINLYYSLNRLNSCNII